MDGVAQTVHGGFLTQIKKMADHTPAICDMSNKKRGVL
ncbi:hypothetical protein A11S_1354 [Micavibrio aeruginosavorus EPB]|uniref:Uncharacterized protein n=1 Tax=Micavibrio aeruginosavorus EPB TaxID=349215 RepID=M4VG22_9BACT|nr:hypothetical protein A11S_1354 [Micavibrio aeruginosavorus EPB]